MKKPTTLEQSERRRITANTLFEFHNQANKAVSAAVERILRHGGPITQTVEMMKLAIEQALKEATETIRRES